ncbi:DUF2690 domain-containing protein [Streptomyces sp. CA-142005]|uniref:helix-turn-helix domain-containing protein n=1 Tax=Streptomyces sp. CA-142005 TaxID=3240052 RepID=UPI003D94FB8F
MEQPSLPGASRGATAVLAEELRGLREQAGLSLAALASRTPFSKSAWHRYLTGSHLPTRSAVETLARLAGTSPMRALELWEAAAVASHRIGGVAAGSSNHEAAERPAQTALDQRRRFWPLKRIAVVSVITVFSVGGAVAATRLLPTARNTSQALGVHCHAKACEGRLPDFSVCVRDARTVSSIVDPAFVLRLRFSPGCGAAWAEIQIHASEGRQVSVRSGRDEFSASYPGDGDGYSSPMAAVSSPRGVVACAEAHGKVVCTGLDGPNE